MTERSTESERDGDFARQAQMRQTGLLSEYMAFLRQEGKWWLAPIFLVLLAAAGLVLVGGTSVAPFIYALF